MSQSNSFYTGTESSQDFSHIASVPWIEEMLKSSQITLHKTICEWASLATQLTDNMEDVNPWVQSFREHLNDTCAEYLNDMRGLQSKILCRIEKCLQKLQTLCSVLKIDMPCVGQKKLCLFQEYQLLKKYIEEYETLIEDKKTKLAKLKKREQNLCSALGKAATVFGENDLPSQTAMDEFEDYISKLENEKFTRLEKFTIIREEMLVIMHDLKYKPSTEFELKIYQSDNDVTVSDENMELLEAFHRRLIQDLQNITEEINHLREEIEHLWNVLDIDLFEREQFRQKTHNNNFEVLEILRIEKQRCQDLKRANIKEFIDKLRNNLLDIWSKCHCNEDVKIEFQFFHTDCYTEDLLELHENELKKWTNFYEENRQLLSLIEKHKKLWIKMLELDENATGPQRYNNRGGQLLKEEKDRNMLSKQIPKIEEELLKLSRKYEEQTGYTFLTFGQTVDDYINSLHEDRENAKKQKLSAKKQQRDVQLTPGRSLHIASASKRKLAMTPMQNSQKKPRMIGSSNSKQVVRKLNIPKITVTCSATKMYSSERKKRLDKVRRSLSKKSDQTTSSDYGAFQNEMTNRVACRSTLLVDLEDMPINSTFISMPSNTPLKNRTPRTPKTGSKLTAAKTNIKLAF